MAGALIFVGCQIFTDLYWISPISPFSWALPNVFPGKESEIPFTYIFSHEAGLFSGWLIGCGLFIFIAKSLSEDVALRYALMAIAFIQVFSVLIARAILTDKEWCEPEKPDLAINTLKEPVEL